MGRGFEPHPPHYLHKPDYSIPHKGCPNVEVLVDGTWRPGEVRMSTQLDEGSCGFNAQWRPPGTDTRRLNTFAESQVRQDTVDRAAGRG